MARIALLIGHSGNRRLLVGELETEHEIRDGIHADEEDTPDLVIADPVGFHANQELLKRFRQSQLPLILPTLLVTTSRSNPSAESFLHPGEDIDDVLLVPTSRIELRARIENLLRLRALTQEQARQERAHRQDLEATHRGQLALNTCNEVLIRATSVSEVPPDLCQALTETPGYRLAWLAMADEGPENASLIVRGSDPEELFEDLAPIRDRPLPEPWTERAQRALTKGTPQVLTEPEGTDSPQLGPCLILPVAVTGGERGALGIGLSTGEDFGEEEQAILQRLPDNLDLGLRSLRSQQDLAQSEAKIRRMAYTDSLTGLANRDFLGEALIRRFQGATDPVQGALLFLDLDNFKLVNDGLGHAAGDLVLEQVAQRLTGLLREGDLLARQGGDEFLILMEGAPRSRPSGEAAAMGREELGDHVEGLAKRIVATLEEPFAVAGHRYQLGVSIGISLYPHDGTDPTELLERADLAMYEAKGHSPGEPAWMFFATAISQKRRSRVTLESELYRAIETQAFRLHFQPILDLRDKQVVAVEALIRWLREDGTLTLPGEFLPTAEESGLIQPLTEWVLGEADRHTRCWQEAGLDWRVAVNLPVAHLQGKEFPERIRELITVEPNRIILEITEEGFAQDREGLANAFNLLHEEGFQFAIDDFGMGYSSLARLQNLPIQTLKIDKHFIQGIGVDAQREAIVRTIHHLCMNLGMGSLAEGVETEAQWQFLLELGCNLGQGFLFSAAAPAEEVPSLVSNQRP